MIVEIGGGEGGLKEYLEHGRKAGRELHRDELDQRVPLFGDLDVFELATSYEGDGKKYDHITLSFSENYVSDEMLKKAVEKWRDHALSAWPEDQRHRIAFYAEAHRPKILCHTNAATGKEEQRLIHIHIGIGRRDLQTGKSVEVLGYLGPESDNLKYIDAFQESFNARHGFSSPKDHPKITPENAVDVIARYTGQKPDALGSFNQKKSAIEITLQKSIVEQNITTWKGLEKLLSEHGEVTKMHEGRFNECFRVKPRGEDRAVRLKGQFFQRQFIERSTDAKISVLMDKARDSYLEQMQPKKAPEHTDPILKEWHETTAREIRFIHKSSPFYKSEYKPANLQTRKQLLADLERKSHAKSSPTTNNRAKEIAAVRGGVPGMPVRNMDGIQKWTAMLLQPDNGMDVSAEHQAARNGVGVRQADPGRAGRSRAANVTHNIQPSSVLARMKSDLLSAYEQASVKDKYTDIGKNIDCKLLLDSLSHSHKINLKHYSITLAKDGTPRIQCGSRALSSSDFLMKELGLSWREAAPILRNTYELQLGKKSIQPRGKISTDKLWKEFKAERDAAYPDSFIVEKLKAFDTNARSQKTALAARLKDEQSLAVKGLSGNDRKAKISQEKMRAVILKAELADALKDERLVYRDSIQPPQAIAWQQFLQNCAQLGDETALAALRKMDATARDTIPSTPGITGTLVIEDENEKKRRARTRTAPVSVLLKELARHQTVEKNGDRTYRLNGQAVLRDEGRYIAILDAGSDEAIAAGLLLGREKFGILTLTGSDSFQRKAVAVAVAQGILVKFADPQLEAMRVQLISERNAGRNAKEAPAVSPIKSVPQARAQTKRAAATAEQATGSAQQLVDQLMAQQAEQAKQAPVAESPIEAVKTAEQRLRGKILATDPRATFVPADTADNSQYTGPILTSSEPDEDPLFIQSGGQSKYIIHLARPPVDAGDHLVKVKYHDGKPTMEVRVSEKGKGRAG